MREERKEDVRGDRGKKKMRSFLRKGAATRLTVMDYNTISFAEKDLQPLCHHDSSDKGHMKN